MRGANVVRVIVVSLGVVAAPNPSTAHHDFSHVNHLVTSLADVTLDGLIARFGPLLRKSADACAGLSPRRLPADGPGPRYQFRVAPFPALGGEL